MKVEITYKEQVLIESLLCQMDGALDYENNNDYEFKRDYGITKEESFKLKKSIIRKLNKPTTNGN